MTTLRTVEEVAEEWGENGYVEPMLREDRQATANALVEALEGKKITDLPSTLKDPAGFCRGMGFNEALTEAQNIIRTLLESKN